MATALAMAMWIFSRCPPAARFNGDPLRPSQRKRCYGHLPLLCADAHEGEAGLNMLQPIAVAPGVFLWREKFPSLEQKHLLEEVQERLKLAPLYKPVMPGSGKPFSVEESNFGR